MVGGKREDGDGRGDAEVPNPPPDSLEVEDDGIDTSLIRWMLSLSPEERLRVLERHVRAVEELRALNPSWNS